ncbi:MAG: hypothetical protein ACREAA_10855 [Candidatus Polarisedimenticolia bacterium]
MKALLPGALLAVLACMAPAAEDAAESRRADLAQFRTQVLGKDRSYSPEARAQAESRLARLESTAGEVSPAFFELELARIVALADNGHTVYFAGSRSRRFNRVNVRLVPFGEDFYVLHAKEPDNDLLGARLVAIDGQPVAKAREAARTLAGGTAAWRDRSAPYFLESPEQMHALGVTTDPEAAAYRFEAVDGTPVERRLAAGKGNPVGGNFDRWFYPGTTESKDGPWRALLTAERAPWALQDPESPFRWRDAPEMGAMIIELRQSTDRNGRSIEAFFEEMTQRLREEKPRNLVLDMRMNGGGDLTRTRDFMQSLPGLVPGRIFALISPWTFSAAISSLGYLEQAAPERVTLVGEPVGDRLRFWAEGQPVELPWSHAVILIATQRHDYLNGCRTFDDCHAEVRRRPISVPTLQPDLAAPWTIGAYRSGRDPAMEAVQEALGHPAR